MPFELAADRRMSLLEGLDETSLILRHEDEIDAFQAGPRGAALVSAGDQDGRWSRLWIASGMRKSDRRRAARRAEGGANATLRCAARCVCALAMVARAAAPRVGAASFPTRPVRIVIPFAAGGFADITMRVLADKLGERLGQRVIIDNRIGGGGVVAAQAVTSSPADGYTLFVLAIGTAISVALFKSLPFDADEGFHADLDGRLFRPAAAGQGLVTDQDARRSAGRGALPGDQMNIGTTIPAARRISAGPCSRPTAGSSRRLVPYRSSPDVLVALLRDDIYGGDRVLRGAALGDR